MVELDHNGIACGIIGLADQSGARHRAAIDKTHEGFIHRAVITAVEDKDLAAACDGAGHAQCIAVGIGRAGRDLPKPQPEAGGEQHADFSSLRRRQHVSEADARLRRDGTGDRFG